MKTVGIIANPASGKDIRRLIASGTTVNNQETQNIINNIQNDLTTTQVRLLEMPNIIGTQQESLRAAELRSIRIT